MRCLFCDKEISKAASPDEQKNGWHKKCVKDFFGSDVIPEIDISDETIKRLAEQSVGMGYTVPGAQKKLSLHLSRVGDKPRLTLVDHPTGYILKPQTELYRSLPEAEFTVMQMAKATGIKTVPFALIRVKDTFAYITRRVDRVNESGRVRLLAMEDFCQLDGRLTEDKYKGSYERCAKIIKKYSSRAAFDLSELFLRIVFCFAVGNSDMHLKNFSLIETAENSGSFTLSQAYDMLPVNVVLPEDTDEFGLTLNGKKNKARRKDFLVFADGIGLNPTAAQKIINTVLKKESEYIALCERSYMPEDMRESTAKMINSRLAILRGR